MAAGPRCDEGGPDDRHAGRQGGGGDRGRLGDRPGRRGAVRPGGGGGGDHRPGRGGGQGDRGADRRDRRPPPTFPSRTRSAAPSTGSSAISAGWTSCTTTRV